DNRISRLKSGCVELLSLLDLLDGVTTLGRVEDDPATELCESSGCDLCKHEDCEPYLALHHILLLLLRTALLWFGFRICIRSGLLLILLLLLGSPLGRCRLATEHRISFSGRQLFLLFHSLLVLLFDPFLVGIRRLLVLAAAGE